MRPSRIFHCLGGFLGKNFDFCASHNICDPLVLPICLSNLTFCPLMAVHLLYVFSTGRYWCIVQLKALQKNNMAFLL